MQWSQERQREIFERFHPHFEALEVRKEPMQEKDEKEQQQQQQQHRTLDGDEQLAQVAEELLDRVSHDQSDKFRNSGFLSLMRQLKEKEVKVQDGEFVSRNAEEQNTEKSDYRFELARDESMVSRPPRSYWFAAQEESIRGVSDNGGSMLFGMCTLHRLSG